MFKRNPGRFSHKITLMKPTMGQRDELGGLSSTSYVDKLTVYAMCEQRSQSRQSVMGDYVSVDTRYFVIRDIRSVCSDINTQWRLRYNGFTYIINNIELIDESKPYFIQITATAINVGGAII